MKSKHPLYSIWKGMIYRCYSPSMRQFRDYGGRGIDVCDRWRNSLENFANDMGPRPEGFLLERKDNNKGYSPENCCWATSRDQQRNQRVTRKVLIDGREFVAADLADITGLKTDTIVERAAAGLCLADVLSKKRRVFAKGLALGGMASGAKKRERTHCSHGHEFTASNTSFSKEGWRRCKTCHRLKMSRYNLQKRMSNR